MQARREAEGHANSVLQASDAAAIPIAMASRLAWVVIAAAAIAFVAD
jgi:hypothetical protein